MSEPKPSAQQQAPKDLELMLGDLARASSPLASLAKKHDMPLQALAQWSSSSCALPALHALRILTDAQAGFVISRSRVQAAKRLLRIATDMKSPETSRKACVDLLNVKPMVDQQAAPALAPMSQAEHRSVLETLEYIGKSSEPRHSK